MDTGKQHRCEPLALFGGTFDPVHYAHLRCAEQARRMLGLERLYLLPAGDPPHKVTPFTTAAQRLEMLYLAQGEFPTLDIDDREMQRSGPSFMVDTLRDLRTGFPHLPLLLLIGQDTVNYLHCWHEWEQLFSLCHIVTFPRPGANPDYIPQLALQIEQRSQNDPKALLNTRSGGFLHLDLELIDISATSIQEIIQKGESPRGMLPDTVLEYINENGLYRPD